MFEEKPYSGLSESYDEIVIGEKEKRKENTRLPLY